MVGLYTGECIVFDSDNYEIMYECEINTKNRRGKFCKGRKVTDINFISNSKALVTTADSRVREIDINVSQNPQSLIPNL